MRSGMKITLIRETLGLCVIDGRRQAISVPRSAVLTVVSDEGSDPMIDVLWEGKTVSMFAVDLHERGAMTRSARQ